MSKPSTLSLWVLLAVQLLAAAYFVLGWSMTGSFTVSNPGQGHERGALVYLILLSASLLGSLACLVALVRRRWQVSVEPPLVPTTTALVGAPLPADSSLLGTWHLARVVGGPAQAPTTDLTFTADGRLLYAMLDGSKWQIMRLTYRCEGDQIITNQPSAPREERTAYRFEADGALVVEFGGEQTWFRRGEPRAPAV